jgi:hypothetical protein
MTFDFRRLPGLFFLVAVTCLSLPARADRNPPMSKDAFEAAEERIEAVARKERKACDRLKGRSAELCVVQAKAREKVARAELEAEYEPSLETWQDARDAKADADYAVAREKCDDFKGAAKSRCVQAAKSAREAAIRLAKVEKVAAMRAAEREAAAERKALATAKP